MIRPIRSLPLLCLLLLTGCGMEPPADALRLTHGVLTLGPERNVQARWPAIAIELPDHWTLERRRRATEGWYRFEQHFDERPTAQGILLLYARLNVQVWVNDVLVGQVGRFSPPIARNNSASLFYPIPDSAWRVGQNRIDIRFGTTLGYRGVLGEIWLGSVAELLPRSNLLRLVGSDLVRAMIVICVVLSLVLFRSAASGVRGTDGDFAFGLGTLMLGAAASGAFFVESPIPSRVFEWAIGSLICWTPLVFTLGLHRVTGVVIPIRERIAIAFFAAATALLWMLWLALSTIFAGYVIYLLAYGAWWQTISRPLAAVLILGLLVSATAVGQLSSFDLRMFIVPLGIGWFVTQRTFRAMSDLSELNQSLEFRIAEREAALQEQHLRLIQLEHERTISAERERLMRELHDGTGGQLVSALAMARSARPDPARMAGMLQEALDDLRLTIESMDPEATDLPTVLGLLREPIERRLAEAGITLEWAVGDAGSGQVLSHEATLHVVRIVQEAATNTIKHSNATRLLVRTRSEREVTADGDHIVLEIQDDGHADALARKGGRGLKNMRERAAALGGELRFDAGTEGTLVQLTMPCIPNSGDPMARGA
jgi:signal transduction histidine kinase